MIKNMLLSSARIAMLNGVDSLDEDMLKKELKENLQERFELEDKLEEVREYIKENKIYAELVDYEKNGEYYIDEIGLLEILDKDPK